MKNHFENELNQLRQLLCKQGLVVESAIRQAIQAFQSGDTEIAACVIENDSIIDLEENRIEVECLKVLALYQPVARDLRTVVSFIKINSSLERMADFACHMAERAMHVASLSLESNPEVFDFLPMENQVLEMLQKTLLVIESADESLAGNVLQLDDSVDAMRREHRMHARSAIASCPAFAEYFIDCIGLARDLERIADLSIDICQQIIYLQTGRIVRHF